MKKVIKKTVSEKVKADVNALQHRFLSRMAYKGTGFFNTRLALIQANDKDRSFYRNEQCHAKELLRKTLINKLPDVVDLFQLSVKIKT